MRWQWKQFNGVLCLWLHTELGSLLPTLLWSSTWFYVMLMSEGSSGLCNVKTSKKKKAIFTVSNLMVCTSSMTFFFFLSCDGTFKLFHPRLCDGTGRSVFVFLALSLVFLLPALLCDPDEKVAWFCTERTKSDWNGCKASKLRQRKQKEKARWWND